MKKILLLLLIPFLLFCQSCQEDEEVNVSILPESLIIDIPDAISESTTNGRIKENEIEGGLIYANLRLFVKVGEKSAELVDDFIKAIGSHKIDQPMEISFISDDDQREKFLKVVENATAQGTNWDYGLNLFDQENNDLAFQLYWNTNPVKGVAIMKIFDIDRTHDASLQDVMYKIEYSEAEAGYEKQMVVSITNAPENAADPGYLDKMKMFVGKKGDVLEIFGNSNHPQLVLVDTEYTGGRNYAYVAKADIKLNIGVAEVGLPPSDIDYNNNLLSDYSIYNVFKKDIENAFNITINPDGWADQAIKNMFKNTEAPGYFVQPEGFKSCADEIPNQEGFTQDFINLSLLKPYVPKDVKNMVIEFE
ncbi:MAG: hypothetical protein ACNS62_18300 [Candidatus Cyclobacteriaceae bacterium M3_2C_046]